MKESTLTPVTWQIKTNSIAVCIKKSIVQTVLSFYEYDSFLYSKISNWWNSHYKQWSGRVLVFKYTCFNNVHKLSNL